MGNGVTVAQRFLGYLFDFPHLVLQTTPNPIRLIPATSGPFAKLDFGFRVLRANSALIYSMRFERRTRGGLTKLKSGSWRVQVRRKNEHVANTFIRRRGAEEWAIEIERSTDRGAPIRRSRPYEQPRICVAKSSQAVQYRRD